MTPQTYAYHHISDPNDCGFSPDDYSRFKYGDNAVAQQFGIALADGFIQNILAQQPIINQIVVVPSPYSFIPTATFAMKDFFVARLNRWLVQHDYATVQEAKVHRTVTYKDDYGSLSAEDRMRLIGNDSFQIDAAFVTGKTLIFLDDIKITGSHERMILKMIDEYHLKNDVFMLYFAELTNKTIHPRFENFLNNHYVKSIFEVEKIIQSGNFLANTRVIKYLLQYENHAFEAFLQRQTPYFIAKIYDLAIGNGYQTIAAYRQNIQTLRAVQPECAVLQPVFTNTYDNVL